MVVPYRTIFTFLSHSFQMAFFTKSAFLIAAERAQAEREAQAKREAQVARIVRAKCVDRKSQYKYKELTPAFFREQRIQQASLRKQLREEKIMRRREELEQIQAARIEAMRIEAERIESERLANAVVPMLLPIVRYDGGREANVVGFEFEQRVRGSILDQNGIIHSHFNLFSETQQRDLTDIDAYVPFCKTDIGMCPVIVEMKSSVGYHATFSIPKQMASQLSLFSTACIVLYTEDTLNLEKLKKNLHHRLDARFGGRWAIATEPTQLLGLLRQDTDAFRRNPSAIYPRMPADITMY